MIENLAASVAASFNDPVGAGEERWRQVDAERLGDLEIDHELELDRAKRSADRLPSGSKEPRDYSSPSTSFATPRRRAGSWTIPVIMKPFGALRRSDQNFAQAQLMERVLSELWRKHSERDSSTKSRADRGIRSRSTHKLWPPTGVYS
jgi:hypothetical protein